MSDALPQVLPRRRTSGLWPYVAIAGLAVGLLLAARLVGGSVSGAEEPTPPSMSPEDWAIYSEDLDVPFVAAFSDVVAPPGPADEVLGRVVEAPTVEAAEAASDASAEATVQPDATPEGQERGTRLLPD